MAVLKHNGTVIHQGLAVSTVSRQPYNAGAKIYDTIPVGHDRLLPVGLRKDKTRIDPASKLERGLLGL